MGWVEGVCCGERISDRKKRPVDSASEEVKILDRTKSKLYGHSVTRKNLVEFWRRGEGGGRSGVHQKWVVKL